MKNYIGVTGFKTVEEINRISSAAKLFGLNNNADYTLMLGFLVEDPSSEVFHVGNKRTPAFAELKSLLSVVPDDLFPVLHYHTSVYRTLDSQLIDVFNLFYESNLCRAVQLNNTWPEVVALENVKKKFPDLEIILSLTSNSLRNSLENVVHRVLDYRGLISHILFDPSGGVGENFNKYVSSDRITDLLNELDLSLPSVSKGVAGGFYSGNVVEQITALARNYSNKFSIDAESRLRTEDAGNLNMEECINYISKAKIYLPK